MIKVLLSGCNGKMGQVIKKLVDTEDNIEITAGFDSSNSINNSFPVYNNFFEVKEEVDVIIDFSNPAVLSSLLKYSENKKLPTIVATTGLSKEQIEHIKKVASNIPIFYSANMSLGVNLLIDLAKRAAKVLETNFDIEIIEKHHNQKLDAPSGTALAIADAINSVLTDPNEYIYDRHNKIKKRDKLEIGMHAVRGGTIVGEHTVLFAGNNEIIEIKHSATSRDVFGVGAINACKFIYGKNPGLYNMNDLFDSLTY